MSWPLNALELGTFPGMTSTTAYGGNVTVFHKADDNQRNSIALDEGKHGGFRLSILL